MKGFFDMALVAKARKIRPGHFLARILCQNPVLDENGKILHGREVPFVDLVAPFNEAFPETEERRSQLYKLTNYLGDIVRYDDGQVVTKKKGREILTVQLVNVADFDPATGQNPSKAKMVEEKVAATPAEKKPRKNAKAVPAPTENVPVQIVGNNEPEGVVEVPATETVAEEAGFSVDIEDSLTEFVSLDPPKRGRPIRDIPVDESKAA
jgi:hypothetical protein